MRLQELMEYKDQVNKILANFNLAMVVWAEEYDDDFSDNGIKIEDIDDFKNKAHLYSRFSRKQIDEICSVELYLNKSNVDGHTYFICCIDSEVLYRFDVEIV